MVGGGIRRTIGWRDLIALTVVVGVLLLLGLGARQMVGPFSPADQPRITLSPTLLPIYTLRTVMRMLAALFVSLIFTFGYATLAAKSRRAGMILIPILDVLQSVPILGYLSFTVVFFVSLFPGNVLGPELAAIFAIFTSQAWNMAFSFYQSLRTVPLDLEEASRSFRASPWQRFWRLEVPFAMPGLVWNIMMSMSGGWFFVVAAEAISVGPLQIVLPGIGSYVALAIQQRDLSAIGWAIAAMTIAILGYDQLLFRPLIAWADKFRVEQTVAQIVPESWVLDLFRRSPLINRSVLPLAGGWRRITRAQCRLRGRFGRRLTLPGHWRPSARSIDFVWYGALLAGAAYIGWALLQQVGSVLSWQDVAMAASKGVLTLFRVIVLIILAALLWVPFGVVVGLRPRLTARVQPIAQFLAAFPANLLFPVAVSLILRFHLAPKIWLSPLMMLGAQWYILFNVIAGASSFPADLREAAASFRVTRWRWWHDVMLPGISPYLVTGAITAAGGAWNASIVAEVVNWGPARLSAGGLGAYIAEMTQAGDYPRIALGIAVMSVLVIAMNRLLWRPLYLIAERRARLN